MPRLPIGETLRAAAALFRAATPRLLTSALPAIAIAEVISLSSGSVRTLTSFLLDTIAWLLAIWASAFSLWVMLQLHGSRSFAPLSSVKFLLFALVYGYLSLTTSLSALLLVLPALFVLATTLLAPAFAITENQGPIEAIVSSVSCVKGNITRFTIFAVVVWLALVVGAILVALAMQRFELKSQVLEFFASVTFGYLSLYFYAVVAVLFHRLHPNPSVNTDAAR